VCGSDGVVLSWSLLIRGAQRARRQAEIPLIVLCRFPGPALSPDGAVIRSSSLARQWRKAKRSIARAKKIGDIAIAGGKAKKIYTKKLRRRFSPVGVRNFSSYSRRSADAFGSKKIARQVRRLESKTDKAIRDLNK
jgi:RNA-directed DNA polymerase